MRRYRRTSPDIVRTPAASNPGNSSPRPTDAHAFIDIEIIYQTINFINNFLIFLFIN